MSTLRHITIQIPIEFTIPTLYMDGSAERIALALTLGAEAVSHIEKSAQDLLHDKSQQEAVHEATKEFERSTQALSLKIKRAEEAARASSLRVEAMEADAANLRGQIQREVTSSFETILKAKDQQLFHAQEALDKAMDSVGRKVEALQNSMTKTFASSKEKGTLGETIMESLLKKAYDCNVLVISKEQQTADIRVSRNQADYLWEVKNYTRMVTSDEIEKLRRDLRLHPDVRGGVLVSLRQGIVGRSRGGDIDVEFLEDGRFILFISHFMAQDDPVFYLQTLRPFFDTIEAMAKPVKEDTEAIRTLEIKAALMTNLLRSHATSVTKHKNALVGHKKRTDTMFAEFQGYILEAEAQLQTILRVAMGGDETSATLQAESTTMLSPLFNKRCLADYAEDRTREFIKWLLSQTTQYEGSQIEIKDVVEKGKADFSEKFIRSMREEIFQEAAWPKGGRFITGLRWIN
jgi:hypothetical protein